MHRLSPLQEPAARRTYGAAVTSISTLSSFATPLPFHAYFQSAISPLSHKCSSFRYMHTSVKVATHPSLHLERAFEKIEPSKPYFQADFQPWNRTFSQLLISSFHPNRVAKVFFCESPFLPCFPTRSFRNSHHHFERKGLKFLVLPSKNLITSSSCLARISSMVCLLLRY